MRRIRDPKSVRLKDRDYDVTPNIIAHMYPQIRNGSVKECEVEMVGEECEVYCEDGRRRVLVLTGHAGRVAPISPMLKRRVLKIAISSLSICRGSPCRWDLETS